MTNLLLNMVDFIIHIDQHMTALVAQHGEWVYAIVFLILFCETGFVVTFFLPGDSLLFVVGALAANGQINLYWMLLLMLIAAILGNMVNYLTGQWLCNRLLNNSNSRWVRGDYLQLAQDFYEKYGGKSLIFARFAPILRTFAPFVAGLSQMTVRRFTYYNIVGAILWVGSITYAGYLFGNFPLVKNNLHYLMIAIIGLSLLLPLVKWWRQRRIAHFQDQAP